MSNKSKNKSKKREFDDISSLFNTLGSEAEVGYRDFPISEIPAQDAQAQTSSAVSAQQPGSEKPKSELKIREDQQDNRAVTTSPKSVTEENHSPTSVVPANDRMPLRPEELEQVDADSHVHSTQEPTASVPASFVPETTTVSKEEFFVGVYASADEPVNPADNAVVMTVDDNKTGQQISAQSPSDDQWEWYELIPPEQRACAQKTQQSDQKNPFAAIEAQKADQDGVSSESLFSRAEGKFGLLPVDHRVGVKDITSSSGPIADVASSITPPVETKAFPAVTEKDSKQTKTGSDQSEPTADASDSHQRVLNSVTNRFRDSFLRGVEKAHTQMQVPDTRFKRVQSKLFESELEQSKQTSESSKTLSTKRNSRLDDYWLLTSDHRGAESTHQTKTKGEPRQHQSRQSTSSTMSPPQPGRPSSSTATPAQPGHGPNIKHSPPKPARSVESSTQKPSQDNKHNFASKPHSSSKKKKLQSQHSKRRPPS